MAEKTRRQKAIIVVAIVVIIAVAWKFKGKKQ